MSSPHSQAPHASTAKPGANLAEARLPVRKDSAPSLQGIGFHPPSPSFFAPLPLVETGRLTSHQGTFQGQTQHQGQFGLPFQHPSQHVPAQRNQTVSGTQTTTTQPPERRGSMWANGAQGSPSARSPFMGSSPYHSANSPFSGITEATALGRHNNKNSGSASGTPSRQTKPNQMVLPPSFGGSPVTQGGRGSEFDLNRFKHFLETSAKGNLVDKNLSRGNFSPSPPSALVVSPTLKAENREHKRKRDVEEEAMYLKRRKGLPTPPNAPKPRYHYLCRNCGFSIPRNEVNNTSRWGSSSRACARGKWSPKEHEEYYNSLIERASNRAVAAAASASPTTPDRSGKRNQESEGEGEVKHCPVPGCQRSFENQGKFEKHLLCTHKLDPQSPVMELMEQLSRSSPKSMEIAAKLLRGKNEGQSVEAILESAGVKGPKGRAKSRRSTVRDNARASKKQDETFDFQSFDKDLYDSQIPAESHIQELGMANDNLIRWNDSSRTRLGLLPLHPPQFSGAFFTFPKDVFRLTLVGGKLSEKLNEYLQDEDDVVFGITHQEMCIRDAEFLGMTPRNVDQLREHGVLETNNEKYDTGLNAITCTRPPPRRFFDSYGGIASRSRNRVESEPGKPAPLFDMRGVSLKNVKPRRLLPVPQVPPRPPSEIQLEDTLWVNEADRLICKSRSNQLRRKMNSDKDDPFVQVGLQSTEMERVFHERFFQKLPYLGAIYNSMAHDVVRERTENVSANPNLKEAIEASRLDG